MNNLYLRGNVLSFFKDPTEPNIDFGLAYAESNENDEVIYNQLCIAENRDATIQLLQDRYEQYVEEDGITMPFYLFAINYTKVVKRILKNLRHRFPNGVNGVQLAIPPSMFM